MCWVEFRSEVVQLLDPDLWGAVGGGGDGAGVGAGVSGTILEFFL